MLWFVLACATKVAPVPALQMGSPAPQTQPPEGESSPSTFGRLSCGLTVGFQGVDERFAASTLSPDGELVVVSEALKGSYEATLAVSLEEEGVGWYTVLGAGDDEDTPSSVSMLSNGHYLVAGSTWSHGAGMSDAWMAELDGGSVQWQRTYGLYDRDVGLGFVPSVRGGLFVTQVPDYGVVVQVVDELGGVQSARGLQGAFGAMHLVPRGEGALLFGSETVGEDLNGRAIAVDSAGQTLWQVGTGLGAPVQHAMVWGDKTLLVLGGEAPSLQQLDAGGQVLETWMLPPELEGLQVSGGRMTEMGPALIGQAEGGSRVVQLDASGGVSWSQTLASVAIFDLHERDGEVVLLGHGEGAKSQDLFAVALDAGTGAGICQLETELTPTREPVSETPAEEQEQPAE